MHQTFDAVRNSFAEALRGLSQAETFRHPDGDRDCWCVHEVIEHLILTYRSTARVLEERLLKGRPTQAPVTDEQKARWHATIESGRFPEGGKAPEPVRPGRLHLGGLTGGGLAYQLEMELEGVDILLNECAEKFGSQPMASHFAYGPLTADQWRQFHVVHARHHLAQIGRIVASTSKNR